FRAVRTLIPATAAAASCVLPSMRLCLSSLTCASVTIGPTPPRDGTLARAVRTAPTGKSSCRRPAKVIVADHAHPRRTAQRLVLDPRHYDGGSTPEVVAPPPLGRMGARLAEIAALVPEGRPLDLYAALVEVAR